jgi:hypothetical protein
MCSICTGWVYNVLKRLQNGRWCAARVARFILRGVFRKEPGVCCKQPQWHEAGRYFLPSAKLMDNAGKVIVLMDDAPFRVAGHNRSALSH